MIKGVLKRCLSLMMAAFMMAALVPVSEITVQAATSGDLTGLSDTNIGASYTATDSGSNANWSASGNTITGNVISASGTCDSTAYETTLTLKNNKSTAAKLSFDYTIAQNGGMIMVEGTAVTANGSYSGELTAGDEIKVYLKSGSTSAATSINITNLSLISDVNATTTFLPGENGSYTVDGVEITAETSKTQNSTVAYTLVATPASGYQFFGWYSVTESKYLSSDAAATLNFDSDQTIKPVFIDSSSPIFETGGVRFYDLNEANNYAKANSQDKIILISDGTLPSGNYTISSGITLVIPFDSTNAYYTTSPSYTTTAATLKAYRTLTMAEGASIDVEGAVSVGAKHYTSSSTNNGNPTGGYGYIKMQEGSSITVENGGNLYAWGYISGGGHITVESGASVYEYFQITDWRGGTATSSMKDKSQKVFPFSQYYVQNVEASMTLKAGATENVYTSITASGMSASATIPFVGTGAMFELSEGGSFTKTYDAAKDRIIFDVEGNVSLNSIALSVLTISVNSNAYVLPINNNVTLNVHSGTTTVNQDIALQPGVQVTIDENAELKVASNCSAYVYDQDQWGTYCQGGQFKSIAYSPTKAKTRSNADLVDVILDVNGTLTADGYIYTTAGGADIKSSEGTGQVVFTNGAGTVTTTYQATQSGSAITYVDIPITSAKLHNDSRYTGTEDEYTVTDGAAAGKTYDYNAEKGMWVAPCTEHTPGEAVVENNIDPTCVEAGSYDSVVYCSVCGEEISRETVSVDAKGHDYTETGRTESTCTEEGVINYECTVCGDTKQETIDAAGHVPETDAAVKPTCTETGLTEGSHCSVCGAVIVEQRLIPALGHDHVGVDTAPTCTEQGYTTYTCSRCGDSYVSNYVDALGHTYGKGVITTPATCTESGVMTYTCTVCEKTKTEKINLLGHNYAGKITTAATCTESGVKTYTCMNEGCNDSYTEAIPAAGHTEVIDKAVEATCTETGLTEGKHCSVCDEVLVDQNVTEALGHNYQSVTTVPSDTDQCVITYTCTRCQDTYSEYVTGLHDIDGDTYYLDENSYAIAGLVKIVKDSGEINYYYFGDDYKAYKATEDKVHYTVENNNGLSLPEGINYVFGEDGVITHFDDTSINGIYFDEASSNYYYCVDGVIIANGLMEIDGYYYYARTSTGAFVCNRDYWITLTHGLLDEGTYSFDENGRIVFPEIEETKNGIVAEEDSIYYYIDGVRTGAGLIQIDGDYYYVKTSNGEVVHGRTYWITATNDLLPSGEYTFDENGKIIIPSDPGDTEVKNGIVKENGSLYYYVDGVVTGAGLIQIDGNYYYVKTSTGEVVHGRSYWITATNGLLPSQQYTFADDGKMIVE